MGKYVTRREFYLTLLIFGLGSAIGRALTEALLR